MIPSTSTSTLETLPDEILLQILDQSTLNSTTISDGAYYPKRIYSELRSLTLVSRRFHRLATPLLFEDITFYHESSAPSSIKECSIVPPCSRALALHRVLKENPLLRSRCLALEIIIDDEAETTEEDFHVANDLVSWLSRTRSLRFYGGFHEETTKVQREYALSLISRASGSMSELKEFLIEGHEDTYCGLSLAEAMEYIDSPCLEILAMTCNGPSDDDDLSRMLVSEKCHSASFTSLTLKYCKDAPEAIEKLLSWPSNLIDFTINTSGNKLVGHISLSDAQDWLSNHASTLEYVYIDLLGHNQGLFFDASIFPHLQGLRLSRTQLNDEDEEGWRRDLRWEASHADRLLTPSLKTFGMSFGILGCCLINNFGSKEVHWLRCLGEAAARRKCGLEKIEILFDPLSAYPHKYGSYPEDYGYPWDRIGELQGDLEKVGIKLVYNSPPWTKEEWEGKIARWLSTVEQ